MTPSVYLDFVTMIVLWHLSKPNLSKQLLLGFPRNCSTPTVSFLSFWVVNFLNSVKKTKISTYNFVVLVLCSSCRVLLKFWIRCLGKYGAWQTSAEGNFRHFVSQLTLFPQRVGSSKFEVAYFWPSCQHLMRTSNSVNGPLWLRFACKSLTL